VARVSERDLELFFPAAETSRRYALASAPIRRVELRAGDRAEGEGGEAFTVEEVLEEDGLKVYCGEGRVWPETRLAGAMVVRGPEDRLFGRPDPSRSFALRLETLERRRRLRQSPARGFAGARIDLIPHQLFVAREIASRQLPRALLADEVGLGKTIEAGLVLHRLMGSGRASRVLVLTPESLVHQWFIELLRRFNASFRVVDEELLEASLEQDPSANPFLGIQTAVCQLAFLARHPERAKLAVEAGWDVVVVDEAHHLHCSEEGVSPEYRLVEALAKRTPGLLLLTATPEQLGMPEHFARLRLLDPDRYHDYADFEKQAERYQAIAEAAEALQSGEALRPAAARRLRAALPRRAPRLRELLGAAEKGDPEAPRRLLAELLDRHGPGRVIFRNTRAALAGFPERRARLAALGRGRADAAALQAELLADVDPGAPRPRYDYAADPRLEWLLDLLTELGQEKVLLICRYREKAEALAAALQERSRVRAAPFHEGLPLLRRDRNAAWFAEEGDAGARLLIASEIGSEGRNFQFAHHLVLFDLPLEPEVLEQRIGRLDRIGQRETIQLHVPWVEGSGHEVLARWYHEGLRAFEESLPSGDYFLDRFGAELLELLRTPAARRGGRLDELVEETRAYRAEIAEQLAGGRDRLLELGSFRREAAEELAREIEALDDSGLDEYLPRLLEHFGAVVEGLGSRDLLLGQSSGMRVESLPGFRREELAVTCDRRRALSREDLEFLSWEHPIVVGAMELLATSHEGNAAVARWEAAPASGLLLEAVLVVECVAPPRLGVDRFLPPTPVHVIVDRDLNERGDLAAQLATARLADERGVQLGQPALRDAVARMLAECRRLAERHRAELTAAARRAASDALGAEVERLVALSQVGDHISKREIQLARRERAQLLEALRGARLRLDALRLVRMQRR
jgi:ATP-dependent helicase HepA